MTGIIEIECAVENNQPFNQTPKKRPGVTHSGSKSGRSRCEATSDLDPEDDGSGKESVDLC